MIMKSFRLLRINSTLLTFLFLIETLIGTDGHCLGGYLYCFPTNLGRHLSFMVEMWLMELMAIVYKFFSE